jgi:hypothetical protein
MCLARIREVQMCVCGGSGGGANGFREEEDTMGKYSINQLVPVTHFTESGHMLPYSLTMFICLLGFVPSMCFSFLGDYVSYLHHV